MACLEWEVPRNLSPPGNLSSGSDKARACPEHDIVGSPDDADTGGADAAAALERDRMVGDVALELGLARPDVVERLGPLQTKLPAQPLI